jgi:predicted metal-dependent hydrolase
MTEHAFDLHSYVRGIRLFNEQRFFDAHEVLEDVWRAAPAQQKRFLQGLIQLAVALHHHSRGNTVGALSLLKRAARNLAAEPAQDRGIHLSELLQSISACADAIEQGRALPSMPRLREPEC